MDNCTMDNELQTDNELQMNRVFLIGRDEIPRKVRLDSGDTLSWTLVFLPCAGADVKVDLDVNLCGPGSSLDLAGIYICPTDEKLSLNIKVKHSAEDCSSSQLFKGLAGGCSRAVFDGLILVEHGAQRTKAVQESHSILLSERAVAEVHPQLEIYADDVECSHGATTGFLNEEEEFYMRSRGIPEAEAKRLQTISFLAPVLARLPENLRNEIISKC